MSYLQKTVPSYWDFEEAIKELNKRKNFRSNTKATDPLRSELGNFNNETVNRWKQPWKV